MMGEAGQKRRTVLVGTGQYLLSCGVEFAVLCLAFLPSFLPPAGESRLGR